MTSSVRSWWRTTLRTLAAPAVFLVVGSGAYALGWTCLPAVTSNDEAELRVAQHAATRAGRQLITQQLIAGQVTFATATERFRTLSQHNPYFRWNIFNEAFPGLSDAECFGGQVMAYVSAELGEKSDRTQAMLKRFQAELKVTPGQETSAQVH
jgi:hypothetical protein